MALEELSIASMILTGISVAVFLILYLKETGEQLKRLWMIMVFLMLMYGFNVEAYGWKNFQIVTALSDISYSILNLIVLAITGLFMILTVMTVLDLFRRVIFMLQGRKTDDEKN